MGPPGTVEVTSPEHADKEGCSCEYRLDGQSWAGENRGTLWGDSLSKKLLESGAGDCPEKDTSEGSCGELSGSLEERHRTTCQRSSPPPSLAGIPLNTESSLGWVLLLHGP